jgi:hypothetical protein
LWAATALRPKPDLRFYCRAGRIWAALFLAVILLRLLVDALAPIDAEKLFLAQARSSFSELEFPRRFATVVALALILMAAGFQGAWHNRSLRGGILLAFASAAIVFLPWLVVFSAANHSLPSLDPLMAMLAVSTVMGAIGSMFGKGFRGMLPAPPRAT